MFNRSCCNRQMPVNNACCRPVNSCCEPVKECPVVEPAVNKCIEENIFHQVDHVIPVHTHMIKRHIYNHTYTPQFSCSEECQVVNNDCGCPKFMNR